MKLKDRFSMLAVVVSMVWWLSAAAGPVAAQTAAAATSRCDCLDAADPDDKAGVIWRGSSPSLSLPELVTLSLRFSGIPSTSRWLSWATSPSRTRTPVTVRQNWV